MVLLVDAVAGPGEEGEVLVVDEDAPILHRRLAHRQPVAHDVECRLLLGSHVGPPYPGRHARQARQVEQSVGGAAWRAADDGEHWPAVVNQLQRVGLPAARHLAGVHLAPGYQGIDQRRLSHGARDDGGAALRRLVAGGQCPAGHGFHVVGHAVGGRGHHGGVGFVGHYRGHHAARHQWQGTCAVLGAESYLCLRCHRHGADHQDAKQSFHLLGVFMGLLSGLLATKLLQLLQIHVPLPIKTSAADAD